MDCALKLGNLGCTEVEPISTYVDFGEREFLVADERGYDYLLYKMAEEFLFTSEGRILDNRLKLNKGRTAQILMRFYCFLDFKFYYSNTFFPFDCVVRELQYSKSGVTVKTEDGCVYEANYVILSVSIGVLQSDLLAFNPPLPYEETSDRMIHGINDPQSGVGGLLTLLRWKLEAIEKCDVMVYTKIFLKFPYKFWPSGPEKEFFIYAHERRGYYTFWQHMENAYPGSNILVVTLTNGESKRVEAQPDEETLREAMAVLRDMFGSNVPDAIDILVPRWWNNRFQRGSYSNYPIISNHKVFHNIKAPVGRIFFTGEHTSERFNGYVHGGYLSGIDTSKALLEEMRKENERKTESQTLLLEPLLALSGSLTMSKAETVPNIHKCDIPTQLYLSGKLGMPEAIL
ncbi:unnamed protein product [Sphenostylis stenocarpa]|uniref:Amine oxidase domain-containing protein n=1 Tax=Sphenostylis stenocarpa TaxID=92480 RepID=A0AA86VJ57_9FABA|nr:unnamed protein product [Sphenostylis stenocarpa]